MPPILQKISTEWFLFEPALFAAFFSHTLVANPKMQGLFRVGKMRVEYNPQILALQTEIKDIEPLLRYEMIRILLGHPYMRQPANAQAHLLTLASNYTIIDNLPQAAMFLSGADLTLKKGLSFEEYYSLLNDDDQTSNEQSEATMEMPNSPDATEGAGASSTDLHDSDEENQNNQDGAPAGVSNASSMSGGSGDQSIDIPGCTSDIGGGHSDQASQIQQLAELSELWEEEPLSQESIIETIRTLTTSNAWGSLPGNIVEMIKSTTISKVDYRRILSLFRSSVLSSNRHLTRMLPSRRYGFDCMGSKRDLICNLLVAVDASGSVSSPQVETALATINRTFKYGIESIDMIQFDTLVYREKLQRLTKATRQMQIVGRGGTSFQPVIDYYCEMKKYDGLLLITDGYASEPTLPPYFKGHILWMLYNESAYKSANRYTLPADLAWIGKFPHSRYLILPET